VDAILIGKGTLLADDPLLTARPPGPRTAARVVLTATAEGLPESCRLLETIQEAPVLVFTAELARERLAAWQDRGADVVGLPAGTGGALDVQSVLTELGNRNMTNVLVEGGAETLGRFLDAGEIDEVHAFIAPKLLGGAAAPSPIGGLGVPDLSRGLNLTEYWVERLGDDTLIHGFRQPIA
jgi:diaminohydroxyphosphoribosylaminopyrimidine deaminase/5-amino-6-(5-phosphoribosylamino)uracil reductase